MPKAALKPHSQFHAVHPDHFQQAKPPLLVTAKANRTKKSLQKNRYRADICRLVVNNFPRMS